MNHEASGANEQRASSLSAEATPEYFGHVTQAFMTRMGEVMSHDEVMSGDELQAWKTIVSVADVDTLESLGISPASMVGAIDSQLARVASTIPQN